MCSSVRNISVSVFSLEIHYGVWNKSSNISDESERSLSISSSTWISYHGRRNTLKAGQVENKMRFPNSKETDLSCR